MFEHRSIRNGHARIALFLAFATLCRLAAPAQETPVTEAQRNPAQVLLFHQHSEDYKGGKQVAVTVYISALEWDGLTAMGLYETVPEGWTFAGARAIGGTMPGVTPKNGDSGVLQFLWIQQSTAPITFQYVLNVPPRESGTRYFSGQVEYRHGEGALTSNVAFSQLNGVADALPVITLQGESSVDLPLNGNFNDPGASASDTEDGDLSSQIQVAGAVDTATPGNYTLVYGVVDSAGNQAVPVMRQVNVSENPTEPVNPTPGGENPNAPGGIAVDGTSPMSNSARKPKETTADKPNVPRITIPNVNLNNKNGQVLDLPLQSGESSETGVGGESGASATETDSDRAFRMAQEAVLLQQREGGDLHAAPGLPDSAEASRAGAQSPGVLLGVALLMGVALIALWRNARNPARRTPRPKA
jgi:hypothetical protein